MSARIGPNIVTDGLVLYLDAGNEKSFCGEPTTNLCGLTTIGIYNNPAIPASSVLTGEYYKGCPIRKITFSPTTALHITNLCNTSGVGAYHPSGTLYYPDKLYMASIYVKLNSALLAKTATLGFNNTYSNVQGWGYSSTSTTQYIEDGWYRLYTKFYKSPYVLGRTDPALYSYIVNTSQTESVIVNWAITTAKDINYLYAIYSNTPYIKSNGGLTGLTITNHGLDSTNWTKISTSNLKLKTDLPFNYYVQLSVPSTGGIDKTIQLRNYYMSYNTAVSDAKYWKITLDANSINIGDNIEVLWTCPMIEQKDIDKPSFYTTNTRGTTIVTGGGWKDLSNNTNDGSLSVNTMSFNRDNIGSLIFNGTSDYVSVANSSSLDFNSGPFTVSFWMKANEQVNNWPAVISKSDGDMTDSNANGRRGWIFYHVNWSPDYWFVLADENTNAGVIPDRINFGNLDTLTWKYITISVGLDSISGYINGALIQTKSRTRIGSTNATAQLNIGRWATYNRCINGNISHVSMYNRDLTAAEILQNYNALKSRYI